MMELNAIWANARYELITLLRSWFFRIFAGASLAIFITLNIIFFSGLVPVPRMFYGLPSGIPYANMIMLNVAQIAIIIFMASDFFKRDRKFNTSEVFYIRSMTNTAYLTGKAFGIFILFASLNFLILIIAIIIQILFSDIPISWVAYLLYPALISFPAFIFMIGFSFLLMQLIKNQAVVVLLLLGYYAAVLFYLYNKWYNIFDLVPVKLPLIYSDFVGFADLPTILLHRGLYLTLGLLFLVIAILLFKRLHQSESLRRILYILTAGFVLLSIFLVKYYIQGFTEISELRSRMIEANQRLFDYPVVTPFSCRIDLEHQNSKIYGEAFYQFINETDINLDTLLFSINPGLQVKEVKRAGINLPFSQNDHLIFIACTSPVMAGGNDSLLIRYHGTIEDAVCYPQIEDYVQNNIFAIWLYQIPKIQSFLTEDYLLLPPECLWYPRAGLPPGTGFPEHQNYNFLNFELELHTSPGLTGISQGIPDRIGPGHFRFKTDFPLPEISLVAGRYDMDSILVDTVEYRLYRYAGHDFYKTFFTEIGDTLGSVIRESMQDYEVRLNLPYPFKRLSLIEVPVQYYVYPRPWTIVQEVVLPEQIWIQENVISIPGADFERLKQSMTRRLDRANQTLTEAESQISVLKIFLNTTFLGEALRGMRLGGPSIEYQPNYNLFGNYYTYAVAFKSEKWPILNSALEAFLFDRVNAQQDDRPIWYLEGLTPAEEVSQILAEKNLSDVLSSSEHKALLPEMIKQKGAFLIKLLQNELGRDNFNLQLIRVLNAARYNTIGFNTFIDQIELPRDFDIENYLQSWYTGGVLPAYLINNIEIFKVYDSDRIRTQLVADITNTSPTTGLLEVTFQYSRRGMGFSIESDAQEDPPKIYRLAAGETRRIGILLDEEPRALNINYLIARNLPLVFTRRFEKVELNERKIPFEGDEITEESSANLPVNELIVDNESTGFQVFNPPFNSILKRIIHGNGDEQLNNYDRFQWWHPPHQWRRIKNATFFGTYIHSAYYIRPGDGQKSVSWTVEIPAEGIFDIYLYMFNQEDFMRGRGDRRRILFQDFNFSVHHSGGVETVPFSADGAPEGWNFLGSWYFSAGRAKVTLSDETSGRVVIADAIKWVKN